MKIDSNMSEEMVLIELGTRIKQKRISMNITQAELALKSGISMSTETRIENGEDSKMSNYLRLLSALNVLENINMLLPESQPDFKLLFEQKTPRQRVRQTSVKTAQTWIWDEDK